MSEQGKREKDQTLEPVKSEWGKEPDDHFGYASDKERLAKRGMEDWELVDRIPESQRGVPVWFIAVVVVVMLVAVGLSFPFWGDRPGFERSWFNWGFVAALVYFAVAGTFVYFMVNLYGSHLGGRLDSDKKNKRAESGGEDAGTPRKGDH
jgi:hypothetical protein